MFNIFSKKKKARNALDEFIFALYGNPPPPARRADLKKAINLAHTDLLGGVVDLDQVAQAAQVLHQGEIPYTTEDLALSTAMPFYKEMEYLQALSDHQLFARVTVLGWLQEGLVIPMLVKTFEDDLYKLYKP
jgi:hypothetical protein